MAKKNNNINTTPSQLNFNTFIEGNVTTEGHLRLDGVIIGNVSCTGKLVIGKKAEVKGNIRCEDADIMGKVEGDLNVKKNVTVSNNANIIGDIYTNTINIEPGAKFNGKCIMTEENE